MQIIPQIVNSFKKQHLIAQLAHIEVFSAAFSPIQFHEIHQKIHHPLLES